MLDMALGMLRCSVCKDRFKSAAITRCFHLFCKECIDENLRNRHRKCPACGEKFGQDDVRNIFFTHWAHYTGWRVGGWVRDRSGSTGQDVLMGPLVEVSTYFHLLSVWRSVCVCLFDNYYCVYVCNFTVKKKLPTSHRWIFSAHVLWNDWLT